MAREEVQHTHTESKKSIGNVMRTCPHCGQVIVPTGLRLPPLKRCIFNLVRRRPGITAEELRSLVWASDPNCGPENHKAVHVHVFQLNQLLAPAGITIRGSKSFGYRIEGRL
jgi:hypothetical protein